jgi:hypothetical protein
MDDSTRVMRRPRRAWPPTPRTAAAIIATAGLALLAAACGASPGSHVAQLGSTATQSSSSSNPSAHETGPLPFSRCMRSRGAPNYPDPKSSGELVKETPQQVGVSGSQYQAAQRACAHLLPNSGGMSQAYVQRLRARTLRVARCMRAHGVTNFPDPNSNGHFPDPLLHRAENSPQYQAANRTCWRLGALPSASPSQGGGS